MTILDHLSWVSVLVATAVGLICVAVGGVVTTGVFRLVDRDAGSNALTGAGDLLRGGTWVGALERIAVFTTLLLGWPEGIAVVLAIKGLGRYADLKSPNGAAGERFIIGTFTSLLTACLGAGVALWLAAVVTP